MDMVEIFLKFPSVSDLRACVSNGTGVPGTRGFLRFYCLAPLDFGRYVTLSNQGSSQQGNSSMSPRGIFQYILGIRWALGRCEICKMDFFSHLNSALWLVLNFKIFKWDWIIWFWAMYTGFYQIPNQCNWRPYCSFVLFVFFGIYN